MKQAQRHREQSLQRAALAGVEERRGVGGGQGGVAAVFVPGEQLGQRACALDHVARIVEECGLVLLGGVEPFGLDPLEGPELGGGTMRRARATGV